MQQKNLKLSAFILYELLILESPEQAIDKLSDFINEFSRFAECKSKYFNKVYIFISHEKRSFIKEIIYNAMSQYKT